VFQVTTNGTLASLVSFTNANGAYPAAGLTLVSDGTFYRTTVNCGSDAAGTVIKLTRASPLVVS